MINGCFFVRTVCQAINSLQTIYLARKAKLPATCAAITQSGTPTLPESPENVLAECIPAIRPLYTKG